MSIIFSHYIVLLGGVLNHLNIMKTVEKRGYHLDERPGN